VRGRDELEIVLNKTGKETDEKYKKEIQNSRDDQKLSVLHYAAKYYHLDLCKLLVVKYEIGNI
jgi:hypothetical protein